MFTGEPCLRGIWSKIAMLAEACDLLPRVAQLLKNFAALSAEGKPKQVSKVSGPRRAAPLSRPRGVPNTGLFI